MEGWKGKYGVYLIAEIGGNYEGNFEYAQRLAELACESGVDAVKFQIYTGDTLVNKLESPDRNAHFKRFELKPEQHITLAKQCRSKGVTYTASVWDMDAIKWIDPYIEFYKIGSGDLTAYPIIKKITLLGKPVILSTGLATFEEVKEAVKYIQSQDSCYKKSEYLALLQCTSMYPIPAEDANLKAMALYKERFRLTVGYSDHTVGTAAVETAIAMGAEIVEMHFTDNREGKEFRDHKLSFAPDEIRGLIKKIEHIKLLQGNKIKTPMQSEIEAGYINSFRRAVYPVVNLKAGTVIKEEYVKTLRPNNGIDARKFDHVIGKKLLRDVHAFERLDWSFFD